MSEAVSLFKIETESGDFVARVTPSSKPLKQMQAEVDLARHLSKQGVPVARPYGNAFELDGGHVTMWHHVKHSDMKVSGALGGQVLAKMHNALIIADPAIFDPIALCEATFAQFKEASWLSESEKSIIAQLIPEAKELWEAIMTDYPPELFTHVHADFHLGNMMLTSKKKAILHDFEVSVSCQPEYRPCVGPPEYDFLRMEHSVIRFKRPQKSLTDFYAQYEAGGREVNRELTKRILPIADLVATLGFGVRCDNEPTVREFRTRIQSIHARDTTARWVGFGDLKKASRN
ncbi:MAG: phosphotransferase enzyme family protein [Mycobacteriales bacterium]